MSIIGSNILAGAAGSGVSAYEIEQSLRFDGSGPSRLTYDNTSGTNNSSSAWTLSFWMKRGDPISSSPYGNDLHLMMWTPSGSCANTEYFLIADPNHGNTTIQNGMSFNGGGYSGNIANKLRDPSAWYHFVWRGNTGSSTNIVYINGVPVTAYFQGPSSMTSALVNGATRWSIGDSYTGCGSSPWEGYLAEVHFVDGQTLDHEDFGEFDDNGVWRPIRYTGTYGTNGYYLKFDPSATNGVGHDHSGNGHHWTASNVTTSGTGTDVMSDTPTTNWATLNPLDKHGSLTLTNGNLDVETSSGYYDVASTFHIESGKYYWEATQTSVSGANEGLFGITRSNNNCQSHSSVDSFRIVYEGNAGAVYVNGTGLSNVTGLATYGVGDTIGAALSIEDGTISYYKNGTLQTTITSASVVGGNVWKPYVGMYQAGWTVNFGQRAFAYTPPTGFKALNTSNLPAPDIADGSQYFDSALYTGSQTSNVSVTGLAFQPDWVWGKNRSSASNHWVFDAVRGTTKMLQPDNVATEETQSGITSFNSDGFTLGTWIGSSKTNDSYVAWCWDAGGSGSSNTDGSITSTVSANPSAGFSIVSYTGTGTAGTVGHGLGVAPSFYVVKNRDGAYFWPCYHASLPNAATSYIDFDNSLAYSPSETHWNSTAPTSTVFSVNTQLSVNNSGHDYIAYCFAEVEGYSKFGSYTGNGSSDGPFVFCGFRPAWILIKRTDTTSNWIIYDSKRDSYNPEISFLLPNSSQAESVSTGNPQDFLSNGIKFRNANADRNASGGTYIFAAFSENPFGGSGVSPATAR